MRYIIIIFILLAYNCLNSQGLSISGKVFTSNDRSSLPYATIILDGQQVIQSDEEGRFVFNEISEGTHVVKVSFLGYSPYQKEIDVRNENEFIEVELQISNLIFDEIVVSGTKTFKRRTQTAVIVNVVDSKTLNNIQACNLSEGLRFQPGLRVETDCQTCNYTQLRMNGLAGGYSQILINGRPIFSPLTGLYGLEQIPVNMIDKIEVVRGAGSSLYGSSAIGGTVNIITKIPSFNSWSINTTAQKIKGDANDFMTSANGTLVSKNAKSGVSLFLNHRNRQAYDHNSDNFSELPQIQNLSLGLSSFILPTTNQKLEFSLSKLNEYRYGGELLDGEAHLAQQSEERTHNVWMASADYQFNFDHATLIAYGAWQQTSRDHYTGIIPDDEEEVIEFLANPPYGTSLTKTFQTGLQYNFEVDDFLKGSNVFTLGSEYLIDDTFDEISAYRYEVDQSTKDLGVFAQSDWEITPSLNLLSGLRIDKHNLVDFPIWSPRISLLYKFKKFTQIRASYGAGFRAPQAFDTDLHIAFAGGGVSRVILDEELKEETSESYSLSINYDRPHEDWIAGFTLEGFYTKLYDAFTLKPIGTDDLGALFLKKNDDDAMVKGAIIELRANYNRMWQIETGVTFQKSRFSNNVEYIDGLEGIKAFVRTPNRYGFINLSYTTNNSFSANVNYVYTGSMIVPHLAGAPNQNTDEFFISPDFNELSTRLSYSFNLGTKAKLELYGGVKNILDSYQNTFDIGKNRDSNFVFGPSLPRSFYLGLKWIM